MQFANAHCSFLNKSIKAVCYGQLLSLKPPTWDFQVSFWKLRTPGDLRTHLTINYPASGPFLKTTQLQKSALLHVQQGRAPTFRAPGSVPAHSPSPATAAATASCSCYLPACFPLTRLRITSPAPRLAGPPITAAAFAIGCVDSPSPSPIARRRVRAEGKETPPRAV